jgi:hypothetical protein
MAGGEEAEMGKDGRTVDHEAGVEARVAQATAVAAEDGVEEAAEEEEALAE